MHWRLLPWFYTFGNHNAPTRLGFYIWAEIIWLSSMRGPMMLFVPGNQIFDHIVWGSVMASMTVIRKNRTKQPTSLNYNVISEVVGGDD